MMTVRDDMRTLRAREVDNLAEWNNKQISYEHFKHKELIITLDRELIFHQLFFKKCPHCNDYQLTGDKCNFCGSDTI